MDPIDPTKLSSEATKTDSDISKNISSKLASAVAEKQRLAIGLLLKQTLQRMSDSGLLSVDTQKAVLSAKKILPSEFTQLYIQERIQQHRVSELLNQQVIKPSPLTVETTRQWFPGQIIQSIVYQATKNGQASLLVTPEGGFHNALQAVTQGSTTNFSGQTQSEASMVKSVPQMANSPINIDLLKQAQAVQIKTTLPLEVGQQLLLQVIKTSNELSFQLNHPPRESHVVSQYLNQLITKQQSMPELLASLQLISKQAKNSSSPFTSQFISQVDKVIQQFPPLSQLSTPTDVKISLINSGQFLENKIVNTAPIVSTTPNASAPPFTAAINQDFKASLLQLVTLIKDNQAIIIPQSMPNESALYKAVAQQTIDTFTPSPPLIFDPPGRVLHAQVQPPVIEPNLFQLNTQLVLQNRILDMLEGVLSRIVYTQLQSRESGGEQQQLLNFEIPFRHNDQAEVLQLKIREELIEKEAQKGNKIWTVNMAFHLPSLGGIRIYITMDKMDLAIQFWTEEQESQRLFQQYFHLLNERLSERGFTLSKLKAFHGVPQSAKEEQKVSQFIIDEKV